MEQLIKKDRIQKLLADYMFTATKLIKEEKVKQAVEVLKAGANYGHPVATLLLAVVNLPPVVNWIKIPSILSCLLTAWKNCLDICILDAEPCA